MLFTLSRIRLGVGHEKMRIFLVIFLRSALPVLFPQTHAVTENGVWLLAGQKPLKRPGWWKGKFTLFWILATQRGSGGWADICPKANSTHTHTHPATDNQWAGAFIGQGRGLHAEKVQLTLTVILKLVIGGLINVILIVLSTLDLQFQGQPVSIL